MADTGPRGPQGPAGTTFDIPVAVANGGTGATTAWDARDALQVESIGGRTHIASGADLNGIKDIGSYCCALNADAATLSNCPMAIAFAMTVSWPTGTGDIIAQTIRRHDTGAFYYRCYYADSDAWSPWYKFEGEIA